MSTDAMYNAESRYLHQMFKVYFSPTNVLEITKNDYLMTSSVLEEAYKYSDSPFGEVTSNELTLTLFNDSGMFNPSDESSPYYGLIKNGIRIEAFIKPDGEEDYDKLGVFYVTDWYTSSNGMVADVTANDALYSILNGSLPALTVYRDISFATFMNIYFAYFGQAVYVDPSITLSLPYVYVSEHSSNKAFLTDIMNAALAECFCDHDGTIKIISKTSTRSLRATLTDDDQIIDISVKQSVTTKYDSASVICYKGQESAEQHLVELSDITLTPGINSTGKLTMSSHPVLSIRSLRVSGVESANVVSFNGSAKDFTCSIQSTSSSPANLTVVGTVLDNVQIEISSEGDAPLTLDSLFIQDETRANVIKDYTESYVNSRMPNVEMKVRGNPKLRLGDIIEVNSTHFKMKYTGVLIKASYNYAGNLSCSLLLADASDYRR